MNKHNLIYITNLRNIIENINSIHHVKFFEILKNNNVGFSENRNGIFFNINSINQVVIKELEEFINYINNQELHLNETEKLKLDIHNELFKDNKEKTENNNIQLNNVA